MKHKTWFRLVLKAIGVFIIAAHALPQVVQAVGQIVWWLVGESRMSFAPGLSPLTGFALHYVHSVVSLAIGLYLLLGGEWLVDRIIPSNRPYCPECGYDLSSSDAARCPECGTVLPPEVRAADVHSGQHRVQETPPSTANAGSSRDRPTTHGHPRHAAEHP